MKEKNTYYGDGYYMGMIPDITVYEDNVTVKNTGLLDSNGNKIIKKSPMGFDLSREHNGRIRN